jgi:hypothetical protein
MVKIMIGRRQSGGDGHELSSGVGSLAEIVKVEGK